MLTDYVHKLLSSFDQFDWLIITLNVVLFSLSGHIVRWLLVETDTSVYRLRKRTLRGINLTILCLYLASGFSEISHFKELSQSALTLLTTWLVIHFLQAWILRRYGREKEFDGEFIRSVSYQSSVFFLIILVISSASSLLILINIWNVTSWLSTTGVLGGAALVLFATKDVWVPDTINGLILLHNGDIEPGNLIRCEELNLFAVVLRITLTQTSLRDLVHRNTIVITNSKLRTCKVENYSKIVGRGLIQFIDFKIGYGPTSDVIDDYFQRVWKTALENESSINPDHPPICCLHLCGDHAVEWRLMYRIQNVYRLPQARFAINRAAYELSLSEDISLSTPITHHPIGLP